MIRILVLCTLFLVSTYTQGSIVVDRTRVIYEEKNKSVSIVVENIDKQDPYLIQSWIENEQGEKISEPLIALPLLQRIDPIKKKQVRISFSNENINIPKNQESLFYFNILGIPPKSKLENAVEIVIQSRFKLFYRPEGLTQFINEEWQKELKIEKTNSSLKLINPTPYHIIIININDSLEKSPDFKEIIIKPYRSSEYNLTKKQNKSDFFTLVYIDDYGTPKVLNYICKSIHCSLVEEKK